MEVGIKKKVLINGKARKLTPLEYERCQGLPDNYTKYGKNKVISDSKRYCAIGNGWECNTIVHIFKYLKLQIEKEPLKELEVLR